MPARFDFDQIADRIHDHYQKLNPGNVYKPFDGLSEFLKADNRDAAMRIGRVLAVAGLRLEHRNGGAWPDPEQDAVRQVIEENIALLAEAEHDGWVESRLRNGWTLGDDKNIDKRKHHLLTSYTNLVKQIDRKRKAVGAATTRDGLEMTLEDEVEAEKEKDRQSVRNYVPIIADTDYKIVQEAGLATVEGP